MATKKPGTRYSIEVKTTLPPKLARMHELAQNLWYTWDKPTRGLFSRLQPDLWDTSGHNPKVFLRRVSEKALADAARDPVFLLHYRQVLSSYDSYQQEGLPQSNLALWAEKNLVAYFCAEFGFHESLPLYSGGLGILAGDHCKAISDLRIPFVGVGIFWRQGYFTQKIDGEGNQVEEYLDHNLQDLPLEPARRRLQPISWAKPGESSGIAPEDVQVQVQVLDRTVKLKVWEARVGHAKLILLDSNLEENAPEDREITHQLYGGDLHMRIKQEIVLGIGGVRAMRALGLTPTAWHINEGHAAFLVLERIREKVQAGLNFKEALETVAASTAFTTHTPVPAGHDHFPLTMIHNYLGKYFQEMNAPEEEIQALGKATAEHVDFNQTVLALRGSRYHNGVSRIHGQVSSEVSASLWPEIEASENPITHITNGVHVPTFLSQDWAGIFDNILGPAWQSHLLNESFWEKIYDIPDGLFWSVHQSLKARMMGVVREKLLTQLSRFNAAPAHLERLFRFFDPKNPEALVIGFARRFATYKRANLLFTDFERLKRIISREERPVLFIFAGKAHPADHPAQEIIKEIFHISRMPEFSGRVFLVEGYDLALARRLVSGVDVWLNNPLFPQEASGTSGMKASINGVINLSVLDGWWGEGYDGKNGWAIQPAPAHLDLEARRREEAQDLYDLLEYKVIPLYYDRGKNGYSPQWVQMAKRAMATILPRFNTLRMVSEYTQRFYIPASKAGEKFKKNDFFLAKEVSAWKAKVRAAWPQVAVRPIKKGGGSIYAGEKETLSVAVRLNGLLPQEVRVEALLENTSQCWEKAQSLILEPEKALEGDERLFSKEVEFPDSGVWEYRLRVYPYHPDLVHPFETGLMRWL